ncbi:MAG: extracellular solute-binding protein [Candidatus Bathyarchaeota archaeon]|nr:MAG: extracellular solute-binding protein [Candidatus Bathyarchaeota archaeon]
MKGQRKGKRRIRLFPKRGYILFLVGILVGFLIFALISAIFEGVGVRAIEFLYTSEKQSWLEEVTPIFEHWYFTEYGERISIKLTVTGTHDSVVQILWGNVKPVAWSPASSIWIPYLNLMWEKLGNQEKIAPDIWNRTVLSPLVIAGWRSLIEDHSIASFNDLFDLARIHDFKYGHPDPRDSNGGTMAVALEFAEAAQKLPENLTIDDFKDESILELVSLLESKAVYYGRSTGFFGRWAAENGPSSISFFSVYENVVLDNSLKAEKKWGQALVAIYPENGTLFTDHPFVILDAPWVESWQKEVAQQYLSFLLSNDNQLKAQQYGFRPANPNVFLNTTIFNESNGVRANITDVQRLNPLEGEALEALFTVWIKVKNQGI